MEGRKQCSGTWKKSGTMRTKKATGEQNSLDPLPTARSNELAVKVETAVENISVCSWSP